MCTSTVNLQKLPLTQLHRDSIALTADESSAAAHTWSLKIEKHSGVADNVQSVQRAPAATPLVCHSALLCANWVLKSVSIPSCRLAHDKSISQTGGRERSTDAGFLLHIHWFHTSQAKSVSNVYKVHNSSKLHVAPSATERVQESGATQASGHWHGGTPDNTRNVTWRSSPEAEDASIST
ncbi:unnamed protein product [Pleuronectes platessa]|uniref:Uncharacterized protein n=1 Tax=Pleuronectes platessa TaxID=8262 RepID=A0A9N7Y4L5_PLEPL|nr:unnamed protein product [Pleuronectes platessa]